MLNLLKGKMAERGNSECAKLPNCVLYWTLSR